VNTYVFVKGEMESFKRTIKWQSCEILINTGFNAIIFGSVILHLTISICNKLLPSLSFVFLLYLFIFYFDSFEKYKYRYLSTTDTHIFGSSWWTHMHSFLLICYSYAWVYSVNCFKKMIIICQHSINEYYVNEISSSLISLATKF